MRASRHEADTEECENGKSKKFLLMPFRLWYNTKKSLSARRSCRITSRKEKTVMFIDMLLRHSVTLFLILLFRGARRYD